MKDKEKKPPFREDLKYFMRGMKYAYKLDTPYFWMQILNGVGNTLRSYVNAFMAALIIDGIAEGKSTGTLITYAIIVVSVNLVVDFVVQFTAAKRYIRRSMWYKFMVRFFNQYSEKMDYWRFEDKATKEQWERITNEISEGKGIGRCHTEINSITHAIVGTLTSVGILSTMMLAKPEVEQSGFAGFVNSPYMIIIFAAMLLVSAICSAKFNSLWNKVSNLWHQYWGKERVRFYYMQDYAFDNRKALDMKTYAMKDMIVSELNESNDKRYKTQKDVNKWAFRAEFGGALLSLVISALAYCIVGAKALSGAFGVGSVVLYVSTLTGFQQETSYFGSVIGTIRGNRKAFEDQFSYIDMPREMYRGTRHVDNLESGEHIVEFRGVSFKYPGCEEYSLKDLNIRFSIGERLAVVGMNGSGKTTFIKLMCRLYDPTEGEILLNGVSIREYDYDEYMKLFSVVFQDFKLFSLPIAENVATTKHYDAEKVERCLRQTGFGERLDKLPKGIDTCIYRNFDKEGVEISGGEAQKIALARALYKNAPFIILDEPTAALDPIAEADVYAKFNEFVGDKTAIYISHRLSSCKFCDSIAVFDKGTLIQRGTHEELVADKDGKYYELWHAQAQYYVE